MTVGKVAIVSIESDTLDVGDDYIIDLPPDTRVPVSRDDIILTPSTKNALEKGIADLFAADEEYGGVSHFQALLKKYMRFTPSYDNRLAVQTADNDYYVANKHRLIPVEYEALYVALAELSGNKTKFITSDRYDSSSLERWLDVNVKSDPSVWYGVKVVVINTRMSMGVTNGGLATYLFIEQSYLDSLGKGWVGTVTSSYMDLKLYPKGNVSVPHYEQYAEMTASIKKSLIPITNVLLLKLDCMNIYFVLAENLVRGVIEALVRYSAYLSEEQYSAVCNEAIKKMGTFKGNQTYGGSKNKLAPYEFPEQYSIELVSEYKLPNASAEKCKDLLYQHIIYVLRAIPERSHSAFGFETQNSPFSIYKRIKNTSPGKELFEEIVSQSDDLIEINALCAGCFADIDVYTVEIANPREAARAFIGHSLSNIRARKYNAETIVSDYEWWSPGYFGDSNTTRRDYIVDRYTAKTWSTTMKRASAVEAYTEPSIPKAVEIPLSKLIKYLFEHPLPGKLKNATWLKQVAASDVEPSNLQIIEIATNEGTTKPPLEATLTELVQNSIDAIREARAKDQKWPKERSRIDIYLKTAPDNSALILQIIDRVGMTSDGFISVAIPFLSTKTPSELVTGEMGSGFFNAYREASQLDVHSVRDGVARWSIDTPIRDDRGRVIDISKNMNVQPAKTNNGTTITIRLPIKDSFEYVTVISKIAYFATKVLGLCRDANIYFNDHSVEIWSKPAGKFGHYEIYYSDRDAATSYESYLLTKGIPFAPLAEYFREHLTDFQAIKTSVFVNITHGGYTPVQTRTRIKIPPGDKDDFSSAAYCTGFVSLLSEMEKGRRLDILDHIKSRGDARQLRFIVYSIVGVKPTERELFKYGKIYPNTPCMAQIINECIDVMQDSVLNIHITNQIDALLKKYSTGYPTVDFMISAVVYAWLTPKNQHLEKEREEKKKKKGAVEVGGDEEITEPDPERQPLVKKWVSTYLDIAEGNIDGFKRKKRAKIQAVNSTKSAPGWFDPNTKTVYINTNRWSKKDFVQIQKELAKKSAVGLDETLKSNKIWNDYFAFTFPAATIPHELEHVRRNSSHDGSHDSATLRIPGRPTESLTFDQCANAVYRYVLSQGFYERLFV